MGLLSTDLAIKRLQAAQGTQDGIEAISSWMLHHTDSSRILADSWLNLFRTESEERRIVLFYILNDVVQRAKKKHVDTVCTVFEQPAITAVSLARFSDKLRNVMHRCLKLIAECKAFSSDGIEKMNRIITDPNGDTDDGNYEIDVIEMARKIEALMQSVVSITNGYDLLKRAPLEFEEQIHTRMKDRKDGALLLKETKTAILRVEKFREAISNNNKRLFEFVDSIETAKRLFNMQLRDVAVVEDAYVKFGQGVREVQEEVDEMVRTGVYPAGSPPRDAPSPSAEDDVFSGGVEQVLNKIRPRDVTDEADMDVEEDEPPLPSYPPPWEKKKPQQAHQQQTPPTPIRPSLVERAAALAASMPTLANHMGIDPRARAATIASHAAAAGPPPAKKPSLDSSLQQAYPPAAAAPAAQQYGHPVTQQSQSSSFGGSTLIAPPPLPPSLPPLPSPSHQSFSVPPPVFSHKFPPPSPAVVAQFMALQQQQQSSSSSAAPLSVHTLPPSIPSVPPPISPFSAPPPGYPPAAAAQQQQYAPMQHNAAPVAQQQQHQQMQQSYGAQQHHQPQQQSHYAPLPARSNSVSGGYANAAATGGYQQPAAVAAGSYQPPAAASGGSYQHPAAAAAGSYHSPPAASGYGNAAAASGGYQQPATNHGGQYSTAPQHQQQQQYPATNAQQGYGREEKKFTAMPEYGRSNSVSGLPLSSPPGGGSKNGGYYPMNTHTPGSSSSSNAAAAAGTPYTPTAPGYRGRKGSEGGGGGTPTRGAFRGRGGGQHYVSGGGYGSRQEEQPAEDAYQPQYRKDSYDGQDGDFRQQNQQQQYQPRGGGQRGFNRGNQGGGGYGGRFQRGGNRGRGGGYGNQQNYGGGYANNQGYS
ncbi:hypothetical protein PFISCL1PPCAC_19367 [Pristionchus fissidentatus]|uniref:CID domain-containing protein n=1 Tax=Pristionchus fissidentatus TaxID=1538716 RepID=A0AAV5W8L4_9BILA|nr:hypothetical protein PFISCL1PPCAC_19367 [Pristionchus fissidentatus]